MHAGEFPTRPCAPSEKSTLASPNLNMRDPVNVSRIPFMPRIHRSGDKMCVYPMYDFTHGAVDSIERITHSICHLEFRGSPPLYDCIAISLKITTRNKSNRAPRLSYTIMSKTQTLQLVQQKFLRLDDPRMPTICRLPARDTRPNRSARSPSHRALPKHNTALRCSSTASAGSEQRRSRA